MADVMQYREVRQRFSVRDDDGPDSDLFPDRYTVTGVVEFTPKLPKGDVLAYPEEFVKPMPITGRIVAGELFANWVVSDQEEPRPLYLPVTVDDEADQTWSWVMRVSSLLIDGQEASIEMGDREFQVEAGDGPLWLSTVAAASKGSGAITLRGPRGYGITDITAESGVVTVEWEGGSDVNIPIPTAALATPTSDGLMPATDKAKLDGISLDTSVGTRVFVGGVMVYGSTGNRDIRQTLIRADTIKPGGTALLGREGNRVNLSLYDIDPSGTGTVRITDTLPIGFRPTARDAFTVSIISGATLRAVVMPTGLYVYQVPTDANNRLRETLSWTTLDPWPTTLPGTPA